jgi:hypothetical protein
MEQFVVLTSLLADIDAGLLVDELRIMVTISTVFITTLL